MHDYFWFQFAGYGFVILAAIVSLASQVYINKAYRKYSGVRASSGLTGADTARRILSENGIYDVDVVQGGGGELSDFYDPTKKIVSLSPKVYQQNSIASISVAAHEVGHAIQHAQGYSMIALRNKILPLANIAGGVSSLPIFLGIIGGFEPMFWFGIIMLLIVALFQLVTLPVEFDASRRALKIIKSDEYMSPSEYAGAKNMLTAAALTYVAGLVASLLTILRYISMNNERNKR